MTHYWTTDYEAARDVLVDWLEQGKLRNFEAHYKGVENCGVAFSDLFAGRNFGKAIVQI